MGVKVKMFSGELNPLAVKAPLEKVEEREERGKKMSSRGYILKARKCPPMSTPQQSEVTEDPNVSH